MTHIRKRMLSGLLSLTLAGSMAASWLPTAAFAAPGDAEEVLAQQMTGTIAMSVCFDLPQTRETIAARDIKLHISGPGVEAEIALLQGTVQGNGLTEEQVSVSEKSVLGALMTTEQRLGRYDLSISGLAKGIYTLELSGEGYATKEMKVELVDYSKHLTVSTRDGSFALGDFDGKDGVTQTDIDLLAEELGEEVTTKNQKFDLNGDEKIDIVDLAYVNGMAGVTASPKELDTALIVQPKVDTSKLTVEGGEISDLFQPGNSLTLKPREEGQSIEIPMEFDGVEMRKIAITTPVGAGGLEKGTALVELEDGTIIKEGFGVQTPDGTLPLTRNGADNVLTIDLGKKVPVKKVTIKVERVVGEDGSVSYVTVNQIEFLKDIVPENPQDMTQVKGVVAKAGEGKVDLVWSPVNNVTGYEVKYGTDPNKLDQTMEVSTTKATISGLKGMTKYYFQVTAVSNAGGESWRGTPSEIVSTVTLADKVPAPPESIRVEPADGALRVSWKAMENASYYQVFYRAQGEQEYTQFKDNFTSTNIVVTGLTNGTTYELMLKAGNSKGVSGPSQVVSGTPKREEFAMPELPTTGRIPNEQVTSIVMADPNNVDRNLAPNFKVEHLMDNNPSTYWVAKNWWSDSSITYTFTTPQDINYMLLVPYLSASHKNVIKTYSVILKDEAGTVLSQGSYPAPALTEEGYLVLTFPETKGVKSITISLAEKEGWGARVSTSEVAFYESDTLADDISALFADGSFTTLRPGVKAEEIAALQQRLDAMSDFYLDRQRLQDELTLAQKLLDSDPSALGLVKSDFQSRSGSQDSKYGQTASDLQPLGVTAQAGAKVAIYADLPSDQPVYVVPTQFYGESDQWKGAAIELKQGRNYITVPKIGDLEDPRGGVLYLTYGGANPEDIKVQVRVDKNASVMPVLELSNWYTLNEGQRKEAITTYVEQLQAYMDGLGSEKLTTNIRNVTEISTPSVLLSLPADQVLAGLKGVSRTATSELVEVMYDNILAWEETMFVANKVQGIVEAEVNLSDYQYPMTTRQNIRYSRMFAGAFMFAAGSYIGVEYGSCAPLVQGQPTSVTGAGKENALFGWGIAHEIGHNMDKLGKAEITNNIYSLAVQAWDGVSMTQNTRLTNDKVWDEIYKKVAEGRPGGANNVFVQLGMYWQLHLAYDNGDSPLNFYNQFFTKWKNGEHKDQPYDDRVALIAGEVTKKNLTDFFTRWGMELSESTKSTLKGYGAEERAIWYLNDSSYASRLKGQSTNPGTATVSAQVKDNEVTLTIQSQGAENLLGYEIRRNGTPIAFTKESTFVDNLGAANNLTYTYTVVPVDIQGKLGEESQPNQVRVAYDKTISADLYTQRYDAEKNAWILTMAEGGVPVTGLKVTSEAELSGKYTVEIKVKDEDGSVRTVTAKEDTLSGTELLAYFNKPGTGSKDTRIWTYDAQEIVITGLPQNVTLALLDYPGDRVDFYEGAAVGTLKEAYQGIPAGTLVILGTYRGDPVYNYVQIEATYNKTHSESEDAIATITRPMAGEAYLFAEIPADGAVSDISDGFFLFVPDMEQEKKLNEAEGVTDPLPLEIKAKFWRTDTPESATGGRLTSETLWISFPDEDAMPQIELTGVAQ